MKYFTTTLIGFIFSLFMGSGNSSEEINDERLVHYAIKEAANEVQAKYGFSFAGISERGDKENDDKYEIIGFFFHSKRYVSKEEAREITIDIVNILLKKLNTPKIQPFLTVYPFSEKNLEVGVTFQIPKKNWDYSQVAFFGLNTNRVYFWYKVPNTKYGLREEYEPYDEALKKLEHCREF